MNIFIYNQLTVPVKIDRRQQQEDTSALLKTGNRRPCAGLQVQWVSWCFMETLLLIVMSNLLIVPVRIDGRYITVGRNAFTIKRGPM